MWMIPFFTSKDGKESTIGKEIRKPGMKLLELEDREKRGIEIHFSQKSIASLLMLNQESRIKNYTKVLEERSDTLDESFRSYWQNINENAKRQISKSSNKSSSSKHTYQKTIK